MEKSVAVLEISSSSVKLTIGYELNGQPQILYTLTKNIPHIVDNGKFLDVPTLQSVLKDLNYISDVSARLNVRIGEVVLILPPFGLDIFQIQQVTTIVGEDSKVSNLDIRNIYALIRKSKIPVTNELIDIIPDRFILDEGTSYLSAPIGKPSNTLTIQAKVHTLPSHIQKNYEGIVRAAGINIKRVFVAPFVASELIATQKEYPSEYILVDIGSHTTTVSIIGGKQLLYSRHFAWGGHNITRKIGTIFNISEDEAEKIKITYGLDKRKTDFPVTICVTDDGNGNETRHYVNELTDIVKSELDSFVTQLNTCVNTLLQGYDPSVRTLPMILIGGGSLLNGLVSYIEPKVQSDYVKTFRPTTIGARHPSFVNSLGAIVANKKYQTVFDESHPKVGIVTREENK